MTRGLHITPFDRSIQNGGTGSGGGSSGSAGGDLSGSYPGPTVAGIQDIPVSSTAPTTDQALIYDGTQWAPDSRVWRPITTTDDGGAHYYVLTDGDGNAVMALS